ncbi:MAG TPA: signal peptide peptidase SppA [Methylomirabilota bacterium]|jgi:protease-4
MRIVVVVLVALALSGCSVLTIDLTPRIRPLEEATVEGRGESKILLLDISGFISEEGTPTLTIGGSPPRVSLLVRVREELKKAEEDRHVRALVVRINSPGGTVTASDIVFRELEMFKQRTKIPVVAVMVDVAASGGYYIALAADTIVAHPTSVTGSIGVIMISVNAQGLMEKLGLATNTIKSGPRKDMGSPFRTLEPEERAIFQSVIDDLYAQFVAKVVERRGIPLDAARTIADGRIYTSEQAMRLRLIDRIGYMNDVLDVARQAAGVSEARVVVYHRPREYRATYYAGPSHSATGVETPVATLAALLGPGPRFLYLWWP